MADEDKTKETHEVTVGPDVMIIRGGNIHLPGETVEVDQHTRDFLSGETKDQRTVVSTHDVGKANPQAQPAPHHRR